MDGTHFFKVTTHPSMITDSLRIIPSRVEKRACFRLEIKGCDPKGKNYANQLMLFRPDLHSHKIQLSISIAIWYVCAYLTINLLETLFNTFENRAEPDQTALVRAVGSRSTLFAYGNMMGYDPTTVDKQFLCSMYKR